MTKDDVIDLIKDAGYGTVATLDGNQPKVRPMMPYLTEEGNLLIATFAKKRIVSQIQKNPKVEVCYISRQMNFARVSGMASICNDKEKKQQVWDNVPMLRQFFSSIEEPDFVLLEINTTIVEAMTPQQETPDIISLK